MLLLLPKLGFQQVDIALDNLACGVERRGFVGDRFLQIFDVAERTQQDFIVGRLLGDDLFLFLAQFVQPLLLGDLFGSFGFFHDVGDSGLFVQGLPFVLDLIGRHLVGKIDVTVVVDPTVHFLAKAGPAASIGKARTSASSLRLAVLFGVPMSRLSG